MSVTLTIRDETTAGKVYSERPLEFSSERITVRELIRERVYQEVQDFNQAEGERTFRGLVQPTDTERVLNQDRSEFKLKQRRTLDWKQQFERAVESFQRNGFFILVDDRQAESLDQEFTVTATTEISFVKLTMLVGG
jgi:hypothetical protein